MIQYLDTVRSGYHLTEDEMMRAMEQMLGGEASEKDIADFLTALAVKGHTVPEITGAARFMRQTAQTIEAPYGAIDCCGTGGDQQPTLNISTAAALVTAACGIPVAKHGNRSSSGRTGSADVLETLGVNIAPPHPVLQAALQKTNFGFLLTTHHHPGLRNIQPLLKTLGQKSIFHTLGPLTNPARTRYKLVGVSDQSLMQPSAEVLRNLKTKRAWIVHGSDGLDEITTSGPTFVTQLDEDGKITSFELTPNDFGLPALSNPQAIRGGTAEENASALRAILEGHENPYREIVLANAAALLKIQGHVETLPQGVAKAADALDSGFAKDTLRDYIALSRKTSEDLASVPTSK